MKKIMSVAFSMLMLCSLLLVGIAEAGNPAYSMIAYSGVFVTVDGQWSNSDEWLDGQPVDMSNNARFVHKMRPSQLTMYFLIEFFGDNTNNAGDLWQICLDSDNSSGAAPDTNDFMIEIQGHNTLKTYKGNGTVWVEFGLSDPFEVTWVNSISPSPWNNAPHWILELTDSNKEQGQIVVADPPNGLRVAAYDASTNTTASWPPNSRADVPSEWGVIASIDPTPYPEGFSILFVVLLSSVAVVVSFYFLRKRPKTESYSSAKTATNTL
jgi:hypothetical protein